MAASQLNLEKFNAYLIRSLHALPDSKTREAMEYALMGEGKRIRPALCIAAAKGYGLDEEAAYPAAAAIEMVHTYSLIHDDLPAMDDDDLRRGRASTHKAFDEATAILAGDALLTQAFEEICNSDVSFKTLTRMVRELAHASGAAGMVYGQDLDLKAEGSLSSFEELEAIETYKTGCLLQLPFVEAACMAGAYEDLDAWRKLGKDLGIQFQIQDDILDVTSSKEELGKSNSDVTNNKLTAVSLSGLDGARKAVEEYGKRIEEDLALLSIDPEEVREIITGLQSRKK